jgi:hypothetical protein
LSCESRISRLQGTDQRTLHVPGRIATLLDQIAEHGFKPHEIGELGPDAHQFLLCHSPRFVAMRSIFESQ